MGVQGSIEFAPLRGYLEAEFNRVSKVKGKLHLHQIQQLQPPDGWPLDLRHPATLFKLDADHDGAVTFQELLEFAEFVNDTRRVHGSLDIQSKLKAQCALAMWELIGKEGGQESFAAWVVVLVSQGDPHRTFDASPSVTFMSRDAVMTLYDLMLPYQISARVDQQGFLDMLQQIGEHYNLMSLEAEELDDWVPVWVVQRWVQDFIAAYASIFQELALEPPESCHEQT